MMKRLRHLFFSFAGRLPRGRFWRAGLLLAVVFVGLFLAMQASLGRGSTLALYPPVFWAAAALAVKRLHDGGRSAWSLLLLLVPVVGLAWLAVELGFFPGTARENAYGGDPLAEARPDYLTVAAVSHGDGREEPADREGTEEQAPELIVDDVTRLNPVPVWSVVRPTRVEEVQDALRRTSGPVSVGGGHFSMGGQTASPGSLHLDMRDMNQVVWFSPQKRAIRVQAGIRWCDIQRFVDPHDLSVKVMQTYANFTVGGSLSVNVHGRYVGLGPLILSARAIAVVLADGSLREASPGENAELFYGAIGGYGGLGVIVEAELDLARNSRVERRHAKLPAAEYDSYFRQHVRGSRSAVFHNADLYPPRYTRARAVTWFETDAFVTQPRRMTPRTRSYPIERYFIWAVTETPLGKWRREFLVDPVVYLFRKVHWRNYEASYDVAELEPASRRQATYVLQEYFVPVDRFDVFRETMAEVLQRHRVNALNISVRHAVADPGSLLAWAREEVFAFVLYYKQRVRENARNRVAVWTRELIDAVLSVGGTYYLPYQPHATREQFQAAYPRAQEFFALKRKLDPGYRLRNTLWDKYYAPTLEPKAEAATGTAPLEAAPAPRASASEFHQVFSDVAMHDGFYRFLQTVYRLYPEDRFHTLIKEACALYDSDERIYHHIQEWLPGIKPALAELRFALPSLAKQKEEMTRQTLEILGGRRDLRGYVEIGSTGRYLSRLRKRLRIDGDVVLVNDVAPSNSPVDIAERGGLRKLGRYVALGDYRPIDPAAIPDASAELVTCYIGLHHSPLDRLDAFVRSIRRVVRPGGVFVVRDHDVKTPGMRAFVSLAHTVFNAGLGVAWETNAKELRHFTALDELCAYLVARGFRDTGKRLLQAHDPSDNTLMAFVKA